jgi:hypothetical protein
MTNLTRCLRPAAAAAYCATSESALRIHGPAPLWIGGRKVYDIRSLDRWVDEMGKNVAASEAQSEEAKAAAAYEA